MPVLQDVWYFGLMYTLNNTTTAFVFSCQWTISASATERVEIEVIYIGGGHTMTAVLGILSSLKPMSVLFHFVFLVSMNIYTGIYNDKVVFHFEKKYISGAPSIDGFTFSTYMYMVNIHTCTLNNCLQKLF